jgi:hypothetical protein
VYKLYRVKASVEVHQLSTETGNTFLNVLHDIPFGVGVWGSTYRHPAYLLRYKGSLSEHMYYLVTFDGPEFASEWLNDNPEFVVVADIGQLLKESENEHEA